MVMMILEHVLYVCMYVAFIFVTIIRNSPLKQGWVRSYLCILYMYILYTT